MSNTEYPKMLYTGDKKDYSCRAVQDANEEQQYRENGLVDYADLDEPTLKDTGSAQGSGAGEGKPQGFITTEQFDAVAERLAAAEAKIKRLHEAMVQPDASVERTHMLDLKTGNPMSLEQGDEVMSRINYSSLTSDQLRALLDEKGIAYLARDNKETLLKLLG